MHTHTRYRREEIEELIENLLSSNFMLAPQINVEALARSKGLLIAEQTLNTDVSGALMSLGNSVYGIAVNAAHAPVRKRFTIAHELGHHLLRHMPEEEHLDWGFTVLRRDGHSSEANDRREIEANFFAASLLMPKHMLREDVESRRDFQGEVLLRDGDILGLAKRYGVSTKAMEYRLMNLGLLSFM